MLTVLFSVKVIAVSCCPDFEAVLPCILQLAPQDLTYQRIAPVNDLIRDLTSNLFARTTLYTHHIFLIHPLESYMVPDWHILSGHIPFKQNWQIPILYKMNQISSTSSYSVATIDPLMTPSSSKFLKIVELEPTLYRKDLRTRMAPSTRILPPPSRSLRSRPRNTLLQSPLHDVTTSRGTKFTINQSAFLTNRILNVDEIGPRSHRRREPVVGKTHLGISTAGTFSKSTNLQKTTVTGHQQERTILKSGNRLHKAVVAAPAWSERVKWKSVGTALSSSAVQLDQLSWRIDQ